VKERLQLLCRANDGYRTVESELLTRLGWAQLVKQPPELTYSASFSKLTGGGRSDAEFYQPFCGRLRKHIGKVGGRMIGEFCSPPSRGVQPVFHDTGTVLAIDSKAVRPHGVEPGAEKVTRGFYDSELAKKGGIRRGDVLLNSTGRGTLGRAACYQLDVSGICDNHITVLRPDRTICDPRYLALFLNSPAGLTQSEQFQTGSSGQLEIYPSHIQKFMVFLPCTKSGAPDVEWQRKLADKLEEATNARAKAKAKLAEAMQLVEQSLGVDLGDRDIAIRHDTSSLGGNAHLTAAGR
jgi:type I restriction enzyme S subunit